MKNNPFMPMIGFFFLLASFGLFVFGFVLSVSATWNVVLESKPGFVGDILLGGFWMIPGMIAFYEVSKEQMGSFKDFFK